MQNGLILYHLSDYNNYKLVIDIKQKKREGD